MIYINTDSSRQKKRFPELAVATRMPSFPQLRTNPNLYALPVEINVVDGILEGDLDLLPHHGGGSLGGGGHTAGGSSNGRSGGGRCGLIICNLEELTMRGTFKM